MLSRLAVVLLHHPVLDRRGEIVTTAITNLDIHDIARTGRTYGIGAFYVVTPAAEQQQLAQQIIDHWQSGHGATHNPDRRKAFELVRVVTTFEEAQQHWGETCGAAALPVLTSARTNGISFAACRDLLCDQPLLLVLGTGSGLAPELFERGCPVLEPLRGAGNYNHLPVRAALAIMLDRLYHATDCPLPTPSDT